MPKFLLSIAKFILLSTVQVKEFEGLSINTRIASPSEVEEYLPGKSSFLEVNLGELEHPEIAINTKRNRYKNPE
jgi:hypothetical protein